MKTRVIAGIASLLVLPLALASAGAANATHNRGTASSFSVAGNTATWVVGTAWESDEGDFLIGDVGATATVTALTSQADAPGSGTSTGVDLTVTSASIDGSNPMYDTSTETLQGDLSALGDGVYELYVSNCCRVPVVNSADYSYVQWVRFTKASGVYNVSPVQTTLSPVTILATSGDTTIDFSATDAEADTVSYSLVTDDLSPYYGFDALPCSVVVGAVLTIGPTHCAGPESMADFTAGSWWGIRVLLTDATGNQADVGQLLHVTGPITPVFDYWRDDADTYEFWPYDDNDEPVATWTIDCVNILDAGDTFTVTSNDLPIVYSGFAPEQDYSCTATGVTGAVSATSPAEILFTTALDGVKIVTDLAIGDTLSGTELRLDGQGLTADSAYDLTQHSVPVLLTAGTADPGGIFNDLFTMPLTACVVGDHALILSGVDDSSAVTTDTIWYRLNSSCVVTQLSRSVSTLAVTGVETGPWVVAAAMFALLGSALVVGSRRRRSA